jgi:hypothetical protein
MARILSVTFETTTQDEPGAFVVPRSAAEVLRLGDRDPVELRITWEGERLELTTTLHSGWGVRARPSEPATRALDDIPAHTEITVTVWRVGDAAAPERDARSSVPARAPRSSLGLRYQRLFQAILAQFKSLRPGATARATVGTNNWLEFASGRPGFKFVWSTAHGKYFRIELYIDVGRQDANKGYFDKLHERADELQDELGHPISWERLPAGQASRLCVYYDQLREDFDTDQGMIDWAAQTMARFVDVIGPVVREM